MKAWASIKNFMGFGSLEEYDDEDFIEEEVIEEEKEDKKAKNKSFTRKKPTSNVVPITSRDNSANVQIFKPQVFEDAYKISSVVTANLVAIFDVAGMKDSAVATRVVDFVSGTVYALGGNMRKITDGIFVAGPRHVDISGDNISEHTRNNFNWNYGSVR
ncbi:MAG: cell division protein SepF [Clostridia bacterium]|nr:cell division protein SepF [Clostridia bacterium]